jgi:hypothetical protein
MRTLGAAAPVSAVAAARLATRTALSPAPDVETVGVVPAASAAAVRKPVVPPEEAEAQVQEETTAMMTAAMMRIRETREAAAVHLLKDAAGHLTDKTSGDIGQGTPGPIQFCKA